MLSNWTVDARMTMSDTAVTDNRVCAALCKASTFHPDAAAPSAWVKTSWLLAGGMGRTYRLRCVVILLPVMPPPDWLWFGQVRISETALHGDKPRVCYVPS